MKKIIELVEKALDTMQLPGFEHTQETYDAFTKVANALAERRQLEHTPITEEWLKEHGFVASDEIHSKRDKVYVKNEITVILDVDCVYGIVGNADCIEINSASNSFHKDTYDNRSRITIATLYDALELCNIKID